MSLAGEDSFCSSGTACRQFIKMEMFNRNLEAEKLVNQHIRCHISLVTVFGGGGGAGGKAFISLPERFSLLQFHPSFSASLS